DSCALAYTTANTAMITTHARLLHIRKSYKKISVGKTPPAPPADRTQSPCGRNGRPPRVWAPLKRAAVRDFNGGNTAPRRATPLPGLGQRCVMVEPRRHPRNGSVRGGINARTTTLHWALRRDCDRPRPFDGPFFGPGAGARAQGGVHEESHPRCLARHDGDMGEGPWRQADARADGVQRLHGKGHRDADEWDRSVRCHLAQ